MKTFKFRAECILDALNFFKFTDVATYTVERVRLVEGATFVPDVVVTFQSAQPLKILLLLAGRVEDGHVLAETLQPLETYTGNRGG